MYKYCNYGYLYSQGCDAIDSSSYICWVYSVAETMCTLWVRVWTTLYGFRSFELKA